MENLLSKIRDQSAEIGIIGQGYVGLPLTMAFAKKFTVFGYDVCRNTVERLQTGKSHIQDVTDEHISRYLGKTYFPTSDPEDLRRCDALIICVPTPLSEDKIPDLSYIKSACTTIKTVLHPGQFVILESTTYPGTTDEVVVPILEETGLVAGSDFGVAYSPERVDPGNKIFLSTKCQPSSEAPTPNALRSLPPSTAAS